MIKYYGGKTWLGKKLNNLQIPKKEGFIDVFTGGGSMTDWAYSRFSKLVVNDIDSTLVNFYNVCKNRPDELLKKFEEIKNENITRYDLINNGGYDDIKKAAYYFFGIECNFGGKPYDTPMEKKVKKFNEKNHKEQIMKINKVLQKCEINNLDYRELIKKYKDNNYFIYLDPPYWDVAGNNYYGVHGANHKGFNHYEFFDTVKEIDKNGNPFMISYEYSDVVRNLYKDYYQFKIPKVTIACSDDFVVKKDTPEILITNFEIKQTKKESLL